MYLTVRNVAAIAVILLAAPVAAQTPAGQTSASQQPAPQPVAQITMPSVTVTAQKEPADAQSLPLSVTPITWDMLASSGITSISDAGVYSPNTYFSDLSARKISNARFRGIGSSPANPGVTTYIDGVPQLNTNTSNIEFLDIEQVEFVRGPQSGLFGRNTLGGLINVNSVRPSLHDWHGAAVVPIGNFSSRDVRANVTGPLTSRLSFSLAAGHASRDGFTENTVTGNDLDSRSATFGKGQLLWIPNARWETRLILNAERARDGDYALRDLAALRANEYQTARDFEGETERDIRGLTFIARREGGTVSLTSTSGLVSWTTFDSTDLDYTPFPLIRRTNDEEAMQLTQELRLASAGGAPIRFSDTASMRWQIGATLFSQAYEQDAINMYAPGLISQFLPFPISQHTPQSELDDFGIGVYAQGTLTLNDRLDITLGARFDHESKEADLNTFYEPAIAPPTVVTESETYSNVSPQFAVAYAVAPSTMAYVSGGAGYKAGGFNPASPSGSEGYGEEQTRHIEAGVKSTWASGRVTANASVFFIDWDDLQLNLANPQVPGQFYIANAGAATSKGAELELGLRPSAGVDLFGALGITNAEFGDGSVSMGVNVSGNEIPTTPGYTATFGGQVTRQILRSWSWVARAEAVMYGDFFFDETNTAGQDAYSLVNLRGGVHGRRYSVDVWMKNAFDTFYVPVAFAFPGLAPSGYVGEPGRPRTFGATLGVRF
ncbi:MAG: TonB-dependent receptor [Acidobacteriota bacterium]|nr:TonB-dependent receptor [Acidobacteriota bacterium]